MISSPQNIVTKIWALFVERRLPWRLSQWLYDRKLDVARRYYDFKVLSTRPYMTGQDSPHFEVHLLLGHKHVGMSLWCVKSFLHYSGREYSVFLHDDGSLTERDVNVLERHLVNVSVVRKAIADDLIREKIKNFPNCCEYRFALNNTTDHRGANYNMCIFAVRLFDFHLLSSASKTLVLDADILFFKKPQEIVEWANDPEDRGSLYSVEQYIPQKNARYEIIGFDRKTPRPTKANAGLLCFDRRAYELDTLDKWIDRDKEMMNKYATFEQRMHQLLLEHNGNNMSLPDSYSFNYTDQNVIATHFAIKHLFFKNIPRVQNVLS